MYVTNKNSGRQRNSSCGLGGFCEHFNTSFHPQPQISMTEQTTSYKSLHKPTLDGY